MLKTSGRPSCDWRVPWPLAQRALRGTKYEDEKMTEPREVEVWLCDHSAASLVPWCRQRATTILCHLDDHGRAYRQNDVRETHARELCAESRGIDRRRRCC
jgi:hypothetical protein